MIKNYSQLFLEVQKTYNSLASLDAKTRFSKIKSLAHTIYQNYKDSPVNSEEIDLYIKIINETIRLHGNRYSRFLSKLIADWLEITGNTKANILTKINGQIDSTISVDTGVGVIAIATFDWFSSVATKASLSESECLEAINKGKAFILYSAPLEKPYSIQLRVIEASEPVLTAKEHKCVIAASEIAIINFPNSSIMVTELQELDEKNNKILASLEPGNYKVRAYHFYIRNKMESFYLVLSKTDQEANNGWLRINEFSPLGRS